MSAASSSSIYVGDLNSEVTEANLFDVFRECGPVLSIRVCRDAVTRVSLCYAYVNFQNPADAQRAMDSLNFQKIKGRACRIMWCRRDPSGRKTATGNIYIKNLAKDIDNKALHDTFVAFGQIVSCKVVTEDDGTSKGYGFVHFAEESAAEEAVKKVDKMLLNGSQVQVAIARKKEAIIQHVQAHFTNVYVKQIHPDTTDEQFKEFFEKYGAVASTHVQRADGKASVGFVTYKEHDSAAKAVAEANEITEGVIVKPKKKLLVCRQQKKAERDRLRVQKQRERAQKYAKYTNLYVKNLADSVTTPILRELFSECGKITGAKVMVDAETKSSKGFGFVCFRDPDAAAKAQAMKGRVFMGKPLFVSTAQRKEQRRMQLELFYRSGRQPFTGGAPAQPQMQMMPQMMPQMGYGGYGSRGGGGGGGRLSRGGGPSRGGGMAYGSRGGGGRGGPRMSRGGIRGGGMQQFVPQPYGAGYLQPQTMGYMPPQPQIGQFMQQQMRMQQMQQPRPQQPAPPAPAPAGPSGIDPGRLALMTQEQQKNFLGEKLFSRITESEPNSAAKITGMLLEMDNAEIINLLDSPELMKSKVKEAVDVLREHSMN